jgi:hypothetical protein
MPTKRRKRQINFEYIVNLIWKKRFYVLIPLTISLAFGLQLSFLMPKIYEARTMILVEPQRVPGDYVRAIVPQDIRSRICFVQAPGDDGFTFAEHGSLMSSQFTAPVSGQPFQEAVIVTRQAFTPMSCRSHAWSW